MSRFEAVQSAQCRLRVADLNAHLMCILCGGYYVDATTIIECLHSFCKSCLVKYLESNRYCPICEVQVHKTKPLLNIRPDETLQSMVYKLVPGLFHREMKFRQEFYAEHPDALPSSPEDRGVVDPIECQYYSPDEPVSLALELKGDSSSSNCNGVYKRYLRCPAAVTVAHLQKLVRNKYGLPSSCLVNVMFDDKLLTPDCSIMDVAYTFQRKRKEQFHFTYQIVEVQCKKRKLENSTEREEVVEPMEVDPSPPAVPSSALTQPAKIMGPPQSESKSKLDSIISRLGTAKNSSKLLKMDKTGDEWKEVQLQISESGVMSVTDISSIDKLINSIEKNVGPPTCKEATGVPKGGPENNKNMPSVKSKVGDEALSSKECKNALPSSKTLKGEVKKEENEEKDVKIDKQLKNSNNSGASESTKIKAKVEENPVKSSADVKEEQRKDIPERISESKPLASTPTSAPLKVYTSGTSAQQNIPRQRDPAAPVATTSSQCTSKPIVTHSSVSATTTPKLCVTLGSSQVTLSISPSPSVTSSASAASAAPGGLSVTKTTSIAPPPPPPTTTTTTLARASPVPVAKPVQSAPNAKKSSSSPVGYKTLKCGPKTWNPTISRSSLLSSKVDQQPQNQGGTGGQSGASAGKPATPPRFFKMRNTPRYLGNPASGVKAMYQVPDTKPETPPPAKSPSVMKVDPRTLSPIVSNASSLASKSSPVPPKGRPPFPSTTLSAQVTSNYMPSSRSVTITTTSNSVTKHADLSSLRNSPTQSMVNPFLPNPFLPKGMPNLLYGVGPGLLSTGAHFASILRPGMGFPPVTTTGFHPSLPQTTSMLFPHQLHRQLNSSSPGSPTGYPPSPSLSLSPSSSSSSSSCLSSKNYSAGQRILSNSEKSSSISSNQSSPSRSKRSSATVSNSTELEVSKVNGSEVPKNSSVNEGKPSSVGSKEQKSDAKSKSLIPSVSKDVKTPSSSPSASNNNNTLSISKTKSPSEKNDSSKLSLDVSNLIPKDTGKCGDELGARSKTPSSSSFQAQQT